MVVPRWMAMYSSHELQRIAEHGDQSQDEIGEKTPCDGWGQWCFAQRNKKKQMWNPCVICHHHPFEGKFAGRTVYVKSLDMCFCALCHVHHLVDTNQTPCKGDGCVQERARCARLILALRTGQVQNEALPPASPAWRLSWPQAVAWPETGTQMATEHGMDRRRQAYGRWRQDGSPPPRVQPQPGTQMATEIAASSSNEQTLMHLTETLSKIEADLKALSERVTELDRVTEVDRSRPENGDGSRP